MDLPDKTVVTPLAWLLTASIDITALLHCLDKLHLQYTIQGRTTEDGRRKFTAEIWKEGIVHYRGYSSNGPQRALADAMSKFFVTEHKDIHEFTEP